MTLLDYWIFYCRYRFDEVYPPAYNPMIVFMLCGGKDEGEVNALDFPTMKLKRGKYAHIKLMDWNQHTDEIGPIFDELMEKYREDPDEPTVELYRSQSELHLLVPIMNN